MTKPRVLNLEEERKQVTAQISALRQWERQNLRSGVETTLIGEQSALLLFPEAGPSQRHCLCLGIGGEVPTLFKNLPCGMLSERRGLELVGRTDLSGCIWTSLLDGEYSLRFVNEVHNHVDVEILVQLASFGDLMAVEHLRAVAEDERLSGEVSDYLVERSGSLPQPPVATTVTVAPPKADVGHASSLWSSPVLFSLGMSTESGMTSALPPNRNWGYSRDRMHIAIDCPIENEENLTFPFGCALIEYQADAGNAAAAVLMPVERNTKLGRFQGSIGVRDLLPAGLRASDPGKLDLWEIRDDHEVWNRLSPEMVCVLFPRHDVRADADLMARLSRLRFRLEEEGRF